LQSGGAERVVTHLLHHLGEHFEMHLVLFNRTIDYQIPPEVAVFDLGQKIKENPFTVLLKIPLLSYKLYRYCKKHKIQTSVSFLNRPCYTNALMKSIWRFKGHIVMCERSHQTTLLNSSTWLYRVISRNLVKYAYKRANLVIANSYSSRNDLIENLYVKTPIRVIYNPIDLDFIQRQSEFPCPIEMDKDTFYFIAVGGFRKEKNFLMLLESFFIIKQLPAKLIIIGGGEEEGLLRQKVNDLDLNDRVIFTGFDSNPFKYVKRSDCFVLSSFVEGFPNVLLEALACGKPIISADCKSGPREMLAPSTDINHTAVTSYEVAEYGILVPVNDVINMAAAMKRMYEDQELRTEYEQKALQRAQHFDVAEIRQYFHVAFSV
jgi:glycosyltransferase involved in cell wall biosynthesis